MQTWAPGRVTSADGTTIGYRRYGSAAPSVILVHGGAQAAQNLGRLATDLSRDFTVYVPDRRGRGASGPPGAQYGLDAERDDLAALVAHSGAAYVFGLSSGGLITLHAARSLPGLRAIAVYEPPLSIDGSTPLGWVARYERELAAGNLPAAAVTAMRGTRTAGRMLSLVPRPLLTAAFRLADRPHRALSNGSAAPPARSLRRGMLRAALWPLRRAARRRGNPPATEQTVPLRELVPTMRYDAYLVAESEGTVANYAGLTTPVLLIGGDRSARYLRATLNRLGTVLPHAATVILPRADHLAADDSGEPSRVAEILRTYFAAHPAAD